MMIFEIFLEFLKIGAFSFGGGFATLPFIYELSEQTNWFSFEEINDMLSISQMTPGPLACNMATYIGFKVEGIERKYYCYNFFYNTCNNFYGYCI